jgi:hypothetical protein
MPSFSILCVNLGNAEVKYFNEKYKNKLVNRNVERRITRRIRKLRPDIVVYVESIGHLEYAGKDPEKPQIRRMLGKDYSILTDKRSQFDGIAVRVSAGQILGCKPGHYLRNKKTERQGNTCDLDFSSQAAAIQLKDGFTFDLGCFHLHSTNVECRVNTLFNMFIGNPNKHKGAILHDRNILVAGDFNLDPWRQDDRSVQMFKELIARGWDGREIRFHNRKGGDDLPELTSIFPFLSRTIDLAASNFASGSLDSLGVTPGTERLDGGEGCDHHALFGRLEYELKQSNT